MNIINKVTLRSLQRNKRRTIVTIIGVIISVAMITAVATIGLSFLDLMKRITIDQSGLWHVQYKDVPVSKIERIQQDQATESVILSKDYGYALLQGGQNKYKPYLFIKGFNEQGFQHFPITLIEGRFPIASDEIVLSEHIATNGQVEYEIGDTLTLEVGRRTSALEGEEMYTFTQSTPFQEEDGIVNEKLMDTVSQNYTVVGLIERPYWEPTWAPGYTVLTYFDPDQLSADETVTASVILNKINHSIYDHADDLARELQLEEVVFHNELLRYYGITDDDNLQKTIIALCTIIILIVMVGSVALIYNAFAISVSERSRHLGMLSSIGATKKQKRNSVFFEGAVIGVISIPLGIAAGLIGIGITFLYINTFLEDVIGREQQLELVVSPLSIVAACVVSMMTIFISSYIPALRASRMTAMDAIRQSHDIKLTRRKVKTSKLVRRLFGFEPELGLKNMKRNRRRYQATVISLVISIVLFMSVTFLTETMKRAMFVTQSGQNYDIVVRLDKDEAKNDWLYHEITSFEDVTEFSKIQETVLHARVEQNELPQVEDAEQYFSTRDGIYELNVRIHALDEDSLRDYADQIGVDVERLLDPSTPEGILIDTVEYYDHNRQQFVKTRPINKQEGDTFELMKIFYENPVELGSVEILKLTDKIPIGVDWDTLGSVDLIVSEPVLKQWSAKDERIDIRSSLYLNSDDPMATQEDIESIDESIDFYNLYQTRREEKQWILLMSVFTYGFISLISAIAVANIFNTISTSIALRRREFAMLRSVGMTPKGFNRMINYESIFYGIKALLYGLPLSYLVIWWIHDSTEDSFNIGFQMPWWSLVTVIICVFLIVGISMLYASLKVKRENIIDALRQDNI